MEEISRVTRTKEQAKISYDKMSRWYDLMTGMEKKFRVVGLKKLDVQENEKILEIGFGTGFCTAALAKSVGGNGKIYGLDISEGMLKQTSSRIKKAGLEGRVELKLGDATNLPYTDNFFDAIFISFVLELFDTPDIPIVLQQFKRVLKNEGRICVVAMSKEGKAGVMQKLYEWSHKKFPKYIDCRPIYVRQVLEKEKFRIIDAATMSMMSLPVEIVLGRK